MKKRITVSALTRVEYTTVVDVPDDATPGDLETVADKVYDAVDGGDYFDDPDYWERSSTRVADADDDDVADQAAEFVASRTAPNGWRLRPVPASGVNHE